MNINKTSGISFEGKFRSEHINDKFDSNEIDCLIDFAKRANEFMKNSTGDNDVVELRFKDRDVIFKTIDVWKALDYHRMTKAPTQNILKDLRDTLYI